MKKLALLPISMMYISFTCYAADSTSTSPSNSPGGVSTGTSNSPMNTQSAPIGGARVNNGTGTPNSIPGPTTLRMDGDSTFSSSPRDTSRNNRDTSRDASRGTSSFSSTDKQRKTNPRPQNTPGMTRDSMSNGGTNETR